MKSEREHKSVVAAITQGDINGIGYEVVLKTLADNRICDFCIPVIYGNSKVASSHRKTITASELALTVIKDSAKLAAGKMYINNVFEQDIKIDFGKIDQLAGKMACLALDKAVADLKSGAADVIVTAPISKKAVQSDTYKFHGHTEYLADKFQTKDFLMMMISDRIKIGIITTHCALKEVASLINKDLIVKKIKIANDSLQRDFAIMKPKIAVLGLNPHCGDEGVIGKEEQEIIVPAIKQAIEQGYDVFGPYPADGFFGSLNYEKFDIILSMYHDQGMLPFKMVAFDDGVNYTAGLPIVRTSPAHGTGFDIAGKNLASPNSFRNALFAAVEIFNNRSNFDELHSK